MSVDAYRRDNPFISVILPVFNEERFLGECLESLLNLDYPRDRYEIIVVDNGSTDNSLRIAKRNADKCYVLKDVNVGAVRNFGVQNAIGTVIAFLDSDCLVPAHWLRCGVELLTNDSLVIGGNLSLRKNPTWIERYWLLTGTKGVAVQKDLLGSCIFIHRSSFDEAGGFDESVTSGEDSLLSNKLKTLGKSVVIDPNVGVVHLGNPQTISEFLKRQAWHAENYAARISTSLKDATFYLVLVYIGSAVGCLGLLVGTPLPVLPTASIFAITPLILSSKRIVRAGFRPTEVMALPAIYAIDHLYLLGRTIGLVRGLLKLAVHMRT